MFFIMLTILYLAMLCTYVFLEQNYIVICAICNCKVASLSYRMFIHERTSFVL
uniref:Uncharacterized protein n=1 Tax=Arundo donax TaxID=35708 RepID=A0A0A9DUK1_ARUDO